MNASNNDTLQMDWANQLTSEQIERRKSREYKVATVLGALGTYAGTSSIIAGALFFPLAPVVGTFNLAVGAALYYGGNRAFAYRSEVLDGEQDDPEREGRISNARSYIGGLSLNAGSQIVMNAAPLVVTNPFALLGVATAGIVAAGYGIRAMARSYRSEDATTEYSPRERLLALSR